MYSGQKDPNIAQILPFLDDFLTFYEAVAMNVSCLLGTGLQ